MDCRVAQVAVNVRRAGLDAGAGATGVGGGCEDGGLKALGCVVVVVTQLARARGCSCAMGAVSHRIHDALRFLHFTGWGMAGEMCTVSVSWVV